MTQLYVGGLDSDPNNQDHVEIVCHALINGIPIHSCLKYGNALHLIKKCIDITQRTPHLILKIYVNSSEPWLRASIDAQLQAIFYILKTESIDAIQICCNPKFKYAQEGYPFREKLLHLKSIGKIKRFYLEVYWQYSENMLKFLGDDVFSGYIFYHNLYLREMNLELFSAIKNSKKEVITLRSLGGNDSYLSHFYSNQQKLEIEDVYRQSGCSSMLEFKISFVKSTPRISGAVCGSSKFNNYIELLSKFNTQAPLSPRLWNRVAAVHDEVWSTHGIGNGEGMQRTFGRKNAMIATRAALSLFNSRRMGVKTGFDW